MKISLIVAMDESGGIGFQGKLPWRLSTDLKRFKRLTMGHHIVMGRKTYESIGRVLPGRLMLIVTRNPSFRAEGSLVVHSLEEALQAAENGKETEIFIIGGGEVFSEAINLADRIYLTRVHAELPADTYFPLFEPSLWHVTELQELDSDPDNEFAHTFMVLDRKKQGTFSKNL